MATEGQSNALSDEQVEQFWRDGYLLCYDAAQLAAMTPLTRRLLGLDPWARACPVGRWGHLPDGVWGRRGPGKIGRTGPR